MADLRKAARGRECQVRIPGVCNGNPETTVLAHIRIAGLCGTGIKPPDLIAAIACSSCHDEIDRRTRLVDAEYAKECALEGMARTQVIWMKEGLIKALTNIAFHYPGLPATTATTDTTGGVLTLARKGRHTEAESPESSKTRCLISAWSLH